MELDEAIRGRRSVRRYAGKPVPIELVHQVLEAGTWAPSSRNRQQWRFTVMTGEAKKRLTTLFRSELEDLSREVGMNQMGSSFNSCNAMEEAPVLIIVWNVDDIKVSEERGRASLQSVAAAIQNMLLKAHSLGLGSLWICDVYHATKAISKRLKRAWTLVAVVTLGWPAQTPEPKPRKAVNEVSEFLNW
jgi:nitroreductase